MQRLISTLALNLAIGLTATAVLGVMVLAAEGMPRKLAGTLALGLGMSAALIAAVWGITIAALEVMRKK